MPQPAELLGLEDKLLNAYRQAWAEIVAEQEALANDPARLVRRHRLREMQERVEGIIDELDDATHKWVSREIPQIYGYGGAVGASDAGGSLVWSQIHQEAVQQLVNRTYDDLLGATTHVRDDTKRLVRTLVRDETVQKAIQGRTAVDSGRRVSKILEERGIAAVVYSDGSRHGLAEYGQMVVRTVSATAYNTGTLNAAHALGVTYWEVFDGPDCGWTQHGAGEMALGKIVTREEALAYPISHPNCRRSFGPRPDLTTPEQAKAAQGGQVTPGQVQAQREQDAARKAAQDRQARRGAVKGPEARLAERQKRLEAREAARLAAEAARAPVFKTYSGLIEDSIAGYRADAESSLTQVLANAGDLDKKAKNKLIRDWLVETNPNPIQEDLGSKVLMNRVAAVKTDKTVEEAMKFYQGAMTKETLSYYSGVRTYVVSNRESMIRPWYDSRLRGVAIGAKKTRLTVHEFGHHFENEMKGFQTRASAFLRYRARQSGKDATEIYRGSGELGWKDKFLSHYMGKLYPGQKDTEIISMGMEMLYAEPARLLEKDPEYFWFQVGLLRGVFAPT